MKLTIEELRKVYETGYMEGDALSIRATTPHQAAQAFHDEAILAVYLKGFKDGAERQRAVEPTQEMLYAGYPPNNEEAQSWGVEDVYRAMSAVAPLVVPE